MTMIIRIPGVDWSGKGFPQIEPFVGSDAIEFGYDFASGSARLKDLTGKHADLVPYRQDIVGGITRTVDPTVVTDASSGLGINVELGYLLTDVALAAIPIDGSVQFTIMVVGGYSGIAFPEDKIAGGGAGISNLYDNGTSITATGFRIQSTLVGAHGTTIKSSAAVMSDAISPNSKKTLSFLTFDGANWSFVNKTLGTSYSKTNAELGISGTLGVNTGHVNKVAMGHYHSSSTLAAAYPTLYQTAKWNRVLTASEMNEQYARTKARKPGIGL